MLRKRRLNECSVNSAHSSRWLLIDHRFYYHLFRFPSAAPSTSPTPPPPPVFSWRYSVLPCLTFRLPFAIFDSSVLFSLFYFLLVACAFPDRFLLLCFGVVLRSFSFPFLFYYFPFFLNSSLCILCIIFAQLRLLLARRTTCLHAPIAIIPPTASKLSTATSPSLISCPCFSAASTATKKTYFSIIRYYCQQLYP